MADYTPAIVAALRLREKHGRHMHHAECIHNMPPIEQVEMRGKTVGWWMTVVGSMPVQITPDEWEIAAPHLLDLADQEPSSSSNGASS